MTENALKKLMIERIATSGPMTIADYMAECLMHPEHGYYQKETVFGADGDFITAPEVSQMYGEMLGLWLADRWYKMGKPDGVQLIELGPGRGTLMSDMLRATAAVEGFQSALTVHFVEASEQLRKLQAELVPFAHWHDTLAQVPDGPSLIVANEFFDALPIHQFEKFQGNWLERRINAEGEDFTLVLTPPTPKLALTEETLRQSGAEGSILEVCPSALSIAGDIAERLDKNGGAALIIDYGYRKSAHGDTFQALKEHTFISPLLEPGTADITAHVAFDQLAKAATSKGAVSYGPAAQGMFLMALGIGARAQQLSDHIGSEEGQSRILSELKRLTAGEEMGTLFKVLALQDKKLAPPAGF
ncbi:class I SAM-dependent methyltransferase [Kordiimonas pumila]|uniref:Class I SAM-dependent methyltransferase n=1 Tax=Kordiimonas pumila TaxID=2161677 RepID=A0ABV7D4W7_9PROT|nr:SAM-dependent methyltransferase [Kordiimonas pumila]